MLKGIQKEYATDSKDLVEAIADCMPQLVAEDRVYKSGPRRGQRKIVFWNSGNDISTIVAEELTGVSVQRFIRACDYTKRSMVQTVLTPPGRNSIQYSKHWIKTFLDDNTDFSDLRLYYRAMTQPWVAGARHSVDAWIATNQPDMAELGTWDGRKYNEWHRAQTQQGVV
jgi:hypothetical protein